MFLQHLGSDCSSYPWITDLPITGTWTYEPAKPRPSPAGDTQQSTFGKAQRLTDRHMIYLSTNLPGAFSLPSLCISLWLDAQTHINRPLYRYSHFVARLQISWLCTVGLDIQVPPAPALTLTLQDLTQLLATPKLDSQISYPVGLLDQLDVCW